MTEASFAAGYLMRVIRPGDLMLPHFPDCWQSGVVVSDVLSRRLPAYLGVDLAGKTRAGNFIVAVCVDPRTQLRYVVAARHGAWSSPDLVTHLADICSMLSNVQVIMVENNGYQDALIDWIKASKAAFPWWTKIEPHTTGRQKSDPALGVPGLEIEFKNKAWVFPSNEWEGHPPACPCSWCALKFQVRDYPKAKHSDALMATWFCKVAIDKFAPVGVPGGRVVSGRGSLTNR